jgi:hypothetical protein
MLATELVHDVPNIFEERPDRIVKLLTRGGELKGAPLEKSLTEIFLELKNLPADGGLLNPIGNVAHRPGDTPVARDITKQLQLMNVVQHGRQEMTLYRPACSTNQSSLLTLYNWRDDAGDCTNRGHIDWLYIESWSMCTTKWRALASHAAPVSGFLLGKRMRKCFHASMKKVNPRRPNAPPGYPIMPQNSR